MLLQFKLKLFMNLSSSSMICSLNSFRASFQNEEFYTRYACLVAEASSDTPEVEQDLVGVVDATVYRDSDVLEHLPGAPEYIYISGITVLNKFRRQKVATALLKACDVLARFWGSEYYYGLMRMILVLNNCIQMRVIK